MSQPSQWQQIHADIAMRADDLCRKLEKEYEDNRRDAKQWALFYLIAAPLTLLVFFAGVGMIILLNITTGAVITLVGGVPAAAAILFRQEKKDANERAENKYKELVEAQQNYSNIQRASMADDQTQNELIKTAALQMLNYSAKTPAKQISEKNKKRPTVK